MRRLVAEIRSANGDLDYALACVDAFAAAGASDIKGQLYTADRLTSRTAKPYGKGLSEPDTQHEAFSKALTYGEWRQVKEKCDEAGVGFFGSVFDRDAVEEGLAAGWSAFKLASGDITYQELIRHTAAACDMSGATLIFSTGAATEVEVMRARGWINDISPDVLEASVQLVCTLSYPTELEDAHVDRVTTWQHCITTAVGYSDHTRGIAAADYAYRIGASLVEKHVTLTPGEGGDHDFASTPDQIARLVDGNVPTHTVSDAIVAGDHRLRVLDTEAAARLGARRSLHTVRDVEAGDRIRYSDVTAVRPGGSIEPFHVADVVGKVAKRRIMAGTMLDWWMLT